MWQLFANEPLWYTGVATLSWEMCRLFLKKSLLPNWKKKTQNKQTPPQQNWRVSLFTCEIMQRPKAPSTSPELSRLTGRGELSYSRLHIIFYHDYGNHWGFLVSITHHSPRLSICPENTYVLKTEMHNYITLQLFIQVISSSITGAFTLARRLLSWQGCDLPTGCRPLLRCMYSSAVRPVLCSTVPLAAGQLRKL